MTGVIRFPNVSPGADVVVSATMFLTYLRCPDQALARRAGAYPADSRTSFRGGLAHRVFARHLVEGNIEPADFDQVCRQEIGQGLNQKISSLGLKPSELAGVIREVGELYERFKRLPTEGFVAAEVFIDIDPAPGVTLRGSIDAIYDVADEAHLVDWKTGQLGQSQDQLWFYAMLWALDRGVLPAGIEAMSVATGERWEARPARADVERTMASVVALIEEIRRAERTGEVLERIPGSWCRYCPVVDSCEDGQAAQALFSV